MTPEPTCRQCGKPSRLIGIEPHHKFTNLDVLTFECMACGDLDVMSQLSLGDTMSAPISVPTNGSALRQN
jgi:hypothetical protein